LSCLDFNDEHLWTEFVRLTQPVIASAVAKTLRRWTRPIPSLIDDLVQETYAKLFAAEASSLRRFVSHHKNAFYGFLKVTAANTAQDYSRRYFAKKRGSGLKEEAIDAVGGLKGNVPRKAMEQNGRMQVRKMEHQIVMKEIDSYLKQRGASSDLLRDYQVFWLYYRDGLTAKSISCIPSIGLTVKGVESLLLRLTQTVRLKMNPQQYQATFPATVASSCQFAKNPNRYSISEQ
jgi:RNA polymerase sigma-70 factor (ECF subfamily)